MVGELGGAEAREQTEGVVEDSDQNAGEWADRSGGDAEVGDEPKRSGSKGGTDMGNQGIEVCLSEAVKEEVGGDKIVAACKREDQGIAVMDAQARVGVGSCRFRTLAEELKHGDARIDRIGSKMRVVREQLGEKAAVSIA